MEFFNCSSGNGCNPFSEANAKTDTVRVVVMPQDEKENNMPNQKPRSIQENDVKKLLRNAQEDERVTSEDAKQIKQLALAAAAEQLRVERERVERKEAEERALAAEKRRQAEEAARAAAEEAAGRQREEARLQALKEAQQEEDRERAERDEHERLEAEARHEKEEFEKAQREAEQKSMEREKVKQFLLEHGYLGVNVKRTKMMKSKYPLHTAVKLADQEMVLLLLSCGADPNLKNSAGETPKQLARKLNKNGSHDGVSGVLPEAVSNVP